MNPNYPILLTFLIFLLSNSYLYQNIELGSYLIIKEGIDCIPGQGWYRNLDLKKCSEKCQKHLYFVHTDGSDCKCVKTMGCIQIKNKLTNNMTLYKVISENKGN